jgi:NitT/TauT family transport system ATP-binding protein
MSSSDPQKSAASLDRVVVRYGARQVLGPFSLDLPPGSSTALVGPSGCGKSTALRLLAGLEQPGEGVVRRAAGRGETAVVFQAPTLAPWATALDNVALPLRLAGVAQDEARARAADALRRVGLAGSERAKPAQLSGGMAMRVSIARALTTQPKLLLMDEPFAALDEITRRRLADDVMSLWTDQRPAMVFVTHSVEEAIYMADRVLVMSPGPGQIVDDRKVPGGFPRPPQFRASEAFREAVEAVSMSLEQAMVSGQVPAEAVA